MWSTCATGWFCCPTPWREKAQLRVRNSQTGKMEDVHLPDNIEAVVCINLQVGLARPVLLF